MQTVEGTHYPECNQHSRCRIALAQIKVRGWVLQALRTFARATLTFLFQTMIRASRERCESPPAKAGCSFNREKAYEGSDGLPLRLRSPAPRHGVEVPPEFATTIRARRMCNQPPEKTRCSGTATPRAKRQRRHGSYFSARSHSACASFLARSSSAKLVAKIRCEGSTMSTTTRGCTIGIRSSCDLILLLCLVAAQMTVRRHRQRWWTESGRRSKQADGFRYLKRKSIVRNRPTVRRISASTHRRSRPTKCFVS